MKSSILYKYLDAEGGLAMLSNSNMQFTNATKLNDPFDCHPSLIDFTQTPEDRTKIWGKENYIRLEQNRFERYRDKTWLCSLSKVNDSLLMWSYYNCHKGICIGIDIEKTDRYLSNIFGAINFGYQKFEVQYKNIIEKPDFFKSNKALWEYQLSTKAKAWEHEQEVRLVLDTPTLMTPYYVPNNVEKEIFEDEEYVDNKEIRFIPKIGGECFYSIYLGVSINKEIKTQIINIARNLNPQIKIHQMKEDAEAFKLQAELLV